MCPIPCRLLQTSVTCSCNGVVLPPKCLQAGGSRSPINELSYLASHTKTRITITQSDMFVHRRCPPTQSSCTIPSRRLKSISDQRTLVLSKQHKDAYNDNPKRHVRASEMSSHQNSNLKIRSTYNFNPSEKHPNPCQAYTDKQ
jgi:hypothetical protein